MTSFNVPKVFVETTSKAHAKQIYDAFASIGYVEESRDGGKQSWYQPYDLDRLENFTHWLDEHGVEYKLI